MFHPPLKTFLTFTAISIFLAPPRSTADPAPGADDGIISVDSTTSLIHIGSLDSFDVTNMGKVAARKFLDFLETGDPAAARDGIAIYDRIIPDENFGGEYTALRWLLQCELADEDERETSYLADPHVRRFREKLMEDEWSPLQSFIRDKYHFGTGETEQSEFAETKRRNRFMEDFILFNNPVRDSWEKSEKMIEMLGLKPGQKVADLGSGPGFFTFKFAELVGDTGKVYAIETNDDHLRYLDDTMKELDIKNVKTVRPEPGGDLGVEEKVDLIFLCSLYHNIYALFFNEERETMIAGIGDALAEDGNLVLVDNGPVRGTLPYHGPYIDRRLVIEQLRHCGFDLVRTEQFIPQRYCLFFKLRKGGNDQVDEEGKEPEAVRPEIPEEGVVVDDLAALPPTPGIARIVGGDPTKIEILSDRSLVRVTLRGISATFSNRGRGAAELFYEALNSMEEEKLERSREIYRELLGAERVGDEYSAFLFFLDYILAEEGERPAFLRDQLVREYFEFFGENDFKRLKIYLKNKYVLGELEEAMKELLEKVPSESNDPKAGEQETPPDRVGTSPGGTGPATPAAPDSPVAGTPSPEAPPTPREGEKTAEPSGTPRPPSSEIAGEPGATGDASEQTPRDRHPEKKEGTDPDNREKQGGDLPHPPYHMLPLDIDIRTIASWWEYLTFSDPRREDWEKAQKVVDFLDLKEGDTVADIGSGAGFYTFKFAEKVGDTGKVFALDLMEEQLDQLQLVGKKAGYNNIVPILSKEDDAMLAKNSIDVAYLCSLYHATYVASMEYVKDRFINSIKRSLRPGGRLVIVDNEPFPTRDAAYYGPHIAKELIISQLTQYGFKFKRYAQFIPQRYVLVFEVEK